MNSYFVHNSLLVLESDFSPNWDFIFDQGTFGSALVNYSFAAGNFGSDYVSRFSNFERNYYGTELINPVILENISQTVLNSSPDLSPTHALNSHFRSLDEFIREDVDWTNRNNILERGEGMIRQFIDLTMFQTFDNTNISADDVFWNERNA